MFCIGIAIGVVDIVKFFTTTSDEVTNSKTRNDELDVNKLIDDIQDIKAEKDLPPLPKLPTPISEPVKYNCKCSSNIYNCSDFGSHYSAQKLYNCCMGKVGYDVHGLDRDKDGSACESL